MKPIFKKMSAAAIAGSLMAGAISYPTQNANAGVGIAVVGALASNGSGTIILPDALAIAAMIGGVGLFSVTCYTLLDDMEPGNYKTAALAFGLLFLDKGVKNDNLQTEIRQKLVTSYKTLDLNENDADLLAQIIVNKVSKTILPDNSSTEILFTQEEIAQVVDSISDTNPALAQKIVADFTKPTLNYNN